MKITKQTTTGQEVLIEISNGYAKVSVAGKSVGTSGIINKFAAPVVKAGNTFVGSICNVGLTKEEAAQVEAELKGTDITPRSDISDAKARALNRQARLEMNGDINQFARGGAL
jgi:hypothetical protein